MLFECGACVGKKSVVAFSFSLFLRLSFLLFRLFGVCDRCCEDSHVVLCSVCAVIVGWSMCSGAQCLAWRGGCRVLVKISAVLLAEDTPPIRIPAST